MVYSLGAKKGFDFHQSPKLKKTLVLTYLNL